MRAECSPEGCACGIALAASSSHPCASRPRRGHVSWEHLCTPYRFKDDEAIARELITRKSGRDHGPGSQPAGAWVTFLLLWHKQRPTASADAHVIREAHSGCRAGRLPTGAQAMVHVRRLSWWVTMLRGSTALGFALLFPAHTPAITVSAVGDAGVLGAAVLADRVRCALAVVVMVRCQGHAPPLIGVAGGSARCRRPLAAARDCRQPHTCSVSCCGEHAGAGSRDWDVTTAHLRRVRQAIGGER